LTTPKSLESFSSVFVMTLLIPRKTVVIVCYHSFEEVLMMVSTMIISPSQSDHNHLLTYHYQTYKGLSSTSTLRVKTAVTECWEFTSSLWSNLESKSSM